MPTNDLEKALVDSGLDVLQAEVVAESIKQISDTSSMLEDELLLAFLKMRNHQQTLKLTEPMKFSDFVRKVIDPKWPSVLEASDNTKGQK